MWQAGQSNRARMDELSRLGSGKTRCGIWSGIQLGGQVKWAAWSPDSLRLAAYGVRFTDHGPRLAPAAGETPRTICNRQSRICIGLNGPSEAASCRLLAVSWSIAAESTKMFRSFPK
jgi:hypothetical protein